MLHDLDWPPPIFVSGIAPAWNYENWMKKMFRLQPDKLCVQILVESLLCLGYPGWNHRNCITNSTEFYLSCSNWLKLNKKNKLQNVVLCLNIILCVNLEGRRDTYWQQWEGGEWKVAKSVDVLCCVKWSLDHSPFLQGPSTSQDLVNIVIFLNGKF